MEIVDSLTPNQQAELFLDPQSGALENETIVQKVFESLTKSPDDGDDVDEDDDKLVEFFEVFSNISIQVKSFYVNMIKYIWTTITSHYQISI